MFYNILSQIFIVKCFTKFLLIRILKKVGVNRLGIVKVYLTAICRDCFFWSFVTFVIDNLVLKSCEPQFKLRTLRKIRFGNVLREERFGVVNNIL